MITIPIGAGPATVSTPARRPPNLASLLSLAARALRVVLKRDVRPLPAEVVCRAVTPTFIVYDVLDVIGAGRR
jgi:hypothetical protein